MKSALTLIHNPTAGDGDHDPAWLIRMLGRAGYKVTYVSYPFTDSRIRAALKLAEIVAVAGGDGTVAKVISQARPYGPLIGILPLGTANNLAKSLGGWRPRNSDTRHQALEAIIDSWRIRKVQPFYPIESKGPWGRRRLIEGIGFGAIEEAISASPDTVEDVSEARKVFANAVMTDAPENLILNLNGLFDGETLNERFAMLEISTIPLVGPNLRLIPVADHSDHEFSISFIRDNEDERKALSRWIIKPEGTAPVSVRNATHLSIYGRFQRVRIDGNVNTVKNEKTWRLKRPIELKSAIAPLPFLIPNGTMPL